MSCWLCNARRSRHSIDGNPTCCDCFQLAFDHSANVRSLAIPPLYRAEDRPSVILQPTTGLGPAIDGKAAGKASIEATGEAAPDPPQE